MLVLWARWFGRDCIVAIKGMGEGIVVEMHELREWCAMVCHSPRCQEQSKRSLGQPGMLQSVPWRTNLPNSPGFVVLGLSHRCSNMFINRLPLVAKFTPTSPLLSFQHSYRSKLCQASEEGVGVLRLE